VKTGNENSTSTEIMPAQQMSRLGVELLMKAALCAAMVALVAGMLAVLIGA
jgi:hypothetical protein